MTQFRGAVDLSTLSSAPGSPSSGYHRLYPRDNNRLYLKEPSGSEIPVGHGGGFDPVDHSISSWSYDPVLITSGQAPTGGTIYLIGQNVTTPATVSNIYFVVTAALTGSFTAGQCWTGLLDSSGAVLQTAAINSNSTGGLQTVSITPQNVVPGLYWVAFLWNGTLTGFTVARGSTSSVPAMNLNRTSGQHRFAINGTSQTTLTNRTPGSNGQTGAFSFWAAIG